MKKRICLKCFLLIIVLSLFFGKYSNNIIFISLNAYQTLLNKKEISMSSFIIKIPKEWFISKVDRCNKEIFISNVPKLFDKNFSSCFVSIKDINMTNENNYKNIINTSQTINHFFCKNNDIYHISKCLTNEKNGRILYLFAKDCNLNSLYTLIKNIDIN